MCTHVLLLPTTGISVSSLWQVQVPYTKSQFQLFRLVHWAMQIRFHSRRGAVHTSNTDISNIWVLSTFLPYSTKKNALGGSHQNCAKGVWGDNEVSQKRLYVNLRVVVEGSGKGNKGFRGRAREQGGGGGGEGEETGPVVARRAAIRGKGGGTGTAQSRRSGQAPHIPCSHLEQAGTGNRVTKRFKKNILFFRTAHYSNRSRGHARGCRCLPFSNTWGGE